AVDIYRCGTDVVRLRLAVQNDVLLPGRVLVPHDLELIDHDDVRLLVAVNIRGEHGITDLQLRVDFLHSELRERGWLGCLRLRRTNPQTRRGYYRQYRLSNSHDCSRKASYSDCAQFTLARGVVTGTRHNLLCRGLPLDPCGRHLRMVELALALPTDRGLFRRMVHVSNRFSPPGPRVDSTHSRPAARRRRDGSSVAR